MATHSSIFAWRIPRTKEPGGPQFIGCKESDTTEVTEHSTAHSTYIGDEKWSGFILKVERKNCNNAFGLNTRKNATEIRKVAVKTSLEKGKYLLEAQFWNR